MTKEEVLRTFLKDELLLDMGYLKEGEAEKFKWTTPTNNNLIKVLQIAIEGETASESPNIIEKKINSLLNKQQ